MLSRRNACRLSSSPFPAAPVQLCSCAQRAPTPSSSCPPYPPHLGAEVPRPPPPAAPPPTHLVLKSHALLLLLPLPQRTLVLMSSARLSSGSASSGWPSAICSCARLPRYVAVTGWSCGQPRHAARSAAHAAICRDDGLCKRADTNAKALAIARTHSGGWKAFLPVRQRCALWAPPHLAHDVLAEAHGLLLQRLGLAKLALVTQHLRPTWRSHQHHCSERLSHCPARVACLSFHARSRFVRLGRCARAD